MSFLDFAGFLALPLKDSKRGDTRCGKRVGVIDQVGKIECPYPSLHHVPNPSPSFPPKCPIETRCLLAMAAMTQGHQVGPFVRAAFGTSHDMVHFGCSRPARTDRMQMQDAVTQRLPSRPRTRKPVGIAWSEVNRPHRSNRSLMRWASTRLRQRGTPGLGARPQRESRHGASLLVPRSTTVTWLRMGHWMVWRYILS